MERAMADREDQRRSAGADSAGNHRAAGVDRAGGAAGAEATRTGKRRGNGARQQASLARREAILAAALDEFSAQGFAAARIDEVALRAGVAKGTIYVHF